MFERVKFWTYFSGHWIDFGLVEELKVVIIMYKIKKAKKYVLLNVITMLHRTR